MTSPALTICGFLVLERLSELTRVALVSTLVGAIFLTIFFFGFDTQHL